MTHAVPLLKFSPSAQDPEILSSLTVQRGPLLEDLTMAALRDGSGLGHHLLVGPRGIGKSHVLTLLTQSVRTSDAHPDRVVVAWLDEDPWAVRSYTKLLVAILGAVGDDLRDDQVLAAAQSLRSRSDPAAPEVAEDELRRFVGERRLMVVVENLDEIFRRIGSDGQSRLRALAENWQQMLIVGSTPQLFAGVSRHSSPFYGFFRVTHLEELTLESATELLRRVARLRGDDRLLAYLGTAVAGRRLLAVSALAGGHPRIWLLFAGCLSIAAIDELVPLFLEALDDLTPYYQDRLRELGDQQQELVILLCESGGALSNSLLAERSGLAANQVAAALKTLADRGYVRRARVPEPLDQGDRRASFWELREPLMRLCLDVKQARGEPLRVVVEFLRAWYGARILDELEQVPETAQLATRYAQEAFRALENLQTADFFVGTPAEVVARADAGLALRPGEPILQAARAAGLIQEGRTSEALELVVSQDSESDAPVLALLASLNLALRLKLAGDTVNWQGLAEVAEEVRKHIPDRADVHEVLGSALQELNQPERALMAYQAAASAGSERAAQDCARVLLELDRIPDALRELERAAAANPDDPTIWRDKGDALARIDRHNEAADAYEHALELAREHDDRAVTLAALGRYGEALFEWDAAIAREPQSAANHTARGNALMHLGRYEEAFEALASAANLAPRRADILAFRGHVALALGRYDEAAEAFGAALDRQPLYGLVQHGLGIALTRKGSLVEAEDAFRQAVELRPDRALFHVDHVFALHALGRFDDASSALSRALASHPADPDVLFAAALTTLDRRRPREAIDRLRAVLACRREAAHADTLCSTVWARYHGERELLRLARELLTAYDDAGALAEFGTGLVGSVGLFVDPDVSYPEAAKWVADWEEASGDLPFSVPLAILAAARDWKRDGDRGHLLRLPPEQREVLMPLLEPFTVGASTAD